MQSPIDDILCIPLRKAAAFLLLLAACGCDRQEPFACRIAAIGEGPPGDKLAEALARLGERPVRVSLDGGLGLAAVDLLILAPGTVSDSTPGFVQRQPEIVDFVRGGGALLVFGLKSGGFRPEFLPAEVRFAKEDPSGWGNYDFSDLIAQPDHPLFNRPHRLEYLGGLAEMDRVVYTGPEWQVLLAKSPHHPEEEASLPAVDYGVGSIFETEWGKGRVLVCQPMIERYFAERLETVPHPLEGGILLFENLIEYMKSAALGRTLPVARASSVPSRGTAGAEFLFRAGWADSAGVARVSWDFGDGGSGEGPECRHRYSQEGVYLVRATVAGRDGSTDSATSRVEVGPAKPMRWDEHLIEAFTTRFYPDAGRLGINYRTALVLNGMIDVYKRNHDPNLLRYLETFFDRRLISRWEDRPYRGNMQPDLNFVDIYSMAPPALEMYRITGRQEYLRIASEIWEHSLAVDGQLPPDALWSPWDWHGRLAIVDFTYFNAHLRGAAWEETGRRDLLDDAARQLIRFRDVFLDPADSLFFMAVDLDRKASFTSPDRPSGLNDSKWNRANGWMALALAELMSRLPEDHPQWKELSAICRTFAGGLARAQDPSTGLWALITDRRDHPGMWLETTGSSMFVYALGRLVEVGVLPAAPFLAVARRGYNGLQQKIGFGAYGYPYLSNACQGTLPRPNIGRWLAAYRHDSDLHVLGPYLMAEEVVWRVAPPEVAVVSPLRSAASGLGRALNSNGFFFYQLPNLYSAQRELSALNLVIVDRGALDDNVADVRAYHGLLSERARQGATVVYLPQEDAQVLRQALPAGMRFADGSGRISCDDSWARVGSAGGNEAEIYLKKVGAGQIVYYPGSELGGLLEFMKLKGS
jgi:rhamnogalacturonyl hydrolase YesR